MNCCLTEETFYGRIERKKCEEKSMSIVGIFKCQDGIFGFCDSKSSLNFRDEPGREKILKCFKNDYLMICNFGNNCITNMKMEDIIPEILKKATNKQDFIKAILKKLDEFNDNREFHFIIYDKNEDEIFGLKFNNFKIVNDEIKGVYALGGNEYYIYCIQQTLHRIAFENGYLPMTRKMYSTILKMKMENLIDLLDHSEFHNPCGKPLEIINF